MTPSKSSGRFGLLTLTIVLLTFSVCAQMSNTKERQFRIINASGDKISSIFAGLAPSQSVRDVLILRKSPSPDSASIAKARFSMLSLGRLVAGPPVFFACPTGGICGSPGTTAGDTSPCASEGCDGLNIVPAPDPNSGVFETYCGADCCVSWFHCTIEPPGPPPPPDPTPTPEPTPDPGPEPTPDPTPDKCTTTDPSQPPPPDCPPLVSSESPVIIDTTGEGFHLTSASQGVRFDISATGHPIQIAWTAAGSGNGFLVLDRNHNGIIDNGAELFGNFTPQPKSPVPNGFLALAEFDKPENGGNGDGIIDQRDAVFSRLVIWLDVNHDGISQPGELHTLPELGIYSLSLAYQDFRRVDQFGNAFRFRAKVNPGSNDTTTDVGRWAFDVFLATTDKQ